MNQEQTILIRKLTQAPNLPVHWPLLLPRAGVKYERNIITDPQILKTADLVFESKLPGKIFQDLLG